MASDQVPGLKHSMRQYGQHVNQRVAIWEPDAEPEHDAHARRFWIVYIHGGAWRDPRRSCLDFAPTVKHLASCLHIKPAIRGYAGLDYRLSPSDKYPQDPASTPPSELRTARHPDHLVDIYAALSFLQTEYQLTDNYILIGHSAGATLAFQLIMGAAALQDRAAPDKVPLPAAMIGLAGVYDLGGLGTRHGPEYLSFIRAAFGPDDQVWRSASPALFAGSFKHQSSARVLLAWSKQDTLVDEPEIQAMAAKLEDDDVDVTANLDMKGDHEQVWEDGLQIAPLVVEIIQREQI